MLMKSSLISYQNATYTPYRVSLKTVKVDAFFLAHLIDAIRGGIKDFNLPDRVSGALKILPDISKIYRTFPKGWHIYLVAYNFFMNHPCDIIQTLNNINI